MLFTEKTTYADPMNTDVNMSSNHSHNNPDFGADVNHVHSVDDKWRYVRSSRKHTFAGETYDDERKIPADEEWIHCETSGNATAHLGNNINHNVPFSKRPGVGSYNYMNQMNDDNWPEGSGGGVSSGAALSNHLDNKNFPLGPGGDDGNSSSGNARKTKSHMDEDGFPFGSDGDNGNSSLGTAPTPSGRFGGFASYHEFMNGPDETQPSASTKKDRFNTHASPSGTNRPSYGQPKQNYDPTVGNVTYTGLEDQRFRGVSSTDNAKVINGDISTVYQASTNVSGSRKRTAYGNDPYTSTSASQRPRNRASRGTGGERDSDSTLSSIKSTQRRNRAPNSDAGSETEDYGANNGGLNGNGGGESASRRSEFSMGDPRF